MPALAIQAARPVDAPRGIGLPAEASALEGGATEDVAAARAGDRGALARLHAAYAPVVHGILLSRLPPSDCDDLVQEVFLNVMRRIASLRDDRAFPAWIATMARNFAASFFRGRGRAGRHAAVVARIGPGGEEAVRSPGAVPQPNPASDALAHLEAEEVLVAIRALPEAYSETLMLRLVEGLTGSQIAARTGMTHGSVRVNLHRGMAMLRERLGIGDVS